MVTSCVHIAYCPRKKTLLCLNDSGPMCIYFSIISTQTSDIADVKMYGERLERLRINCNFF